MQTKRTHTYVDDPQTRQRQDSGLDGMRQSRNRAYLAAGIGFLFAVVELVAIVTMLPLKKPVPVIITVDSASGHVVQTQIATPDLISSNEALVMTELHDYVVDRDTVDSQNRQSLSDYVRLHSTEEVAREYAQEMSSDNPKNPYYVVGKEGWRKVVVTGISLPEKNRGQVFYRTETHRAGAHVETRFYQATITFAITAKPLALQDRWINPLGFAVTGWRSDQELSR